MPLISEPAITPAALSIAPKNWEANSKSVSRARKKGDSPLFSPFFSRNLGFPVAPIISLRALRLTTLAECKQGSGGVAREDGRLVQALEGGFFLDADFKVVKKRARREISVFLIRAIDAP